MGVECSQDEREFRYKTLYEALHTIDKDIKKELKNNNNQSKKYIFPMDYSIKAFVKNIHFY